MHCSSVGPCRTFGETIWLLLQGYEYRHVPHAFFPLNTAACRIEQCFSTAGPRPGTGPWHQLYRAARDSPGIGNYLNVILYLSACHTVHISVLILFMIMP